MIPSAQELDASPSLKIYPNKTMAVVRVLFCVLMLAGSIWAAFTPIQPEDRMDQRIAHSISAYLCPIIFLGATAWAVKLLVTKEPVLAMDATGIRVELAGLRTVSLPWSEIARIQRINIRQYPALGVIASNVNHLGEVVLEKDAKLMARNQVQFGAALGLHEQLLPGNVKSILIQLKTFCNEHYPQYADYIVIP